MYPRLSDLINDLVGTNMILPVQTYGFFVAMAFVFGGLIVYLELRRKERENIIFPREKIRIEGNPATMRELILNAVISFIIGYKLIGAFIAYEEFAESPQQYILSARGSWWGGIALAIIVTFLTYYEKKEKKKIRPG